MTEEERDNGLETLFRDKLEENEMEAGSDLRRRVMHRLERLEFFRFNLSRFNFYYVTAALAVLTVAGVLIFSGHGTGPQPDGDEVPEKTVTGTTVDAVDTPGDAKEAVEDVKKSDAPVNSTAGMKSSAGTSADRQLYKEPELTSRHPEAETVRVSTISNGTIAAASPVSFLSVGASATSGCVPLNVSFECNANEDQDISWNFGDGGTSSLRNPEYLFDIPGTYMVTLTTTDNRGRTSSASTSVVVYGRPEAAFEVQRDDPYDEGDRVTFVNLSKGAVEYIWNFGDGVFSALSDPVHRYRETGVFDVSLVAWSAEGCADSVTVSDLFTDRGMYIRFPNAFVPAEEGPTGGYYNMRTDEESSVFHPVAAGIADYNLKIYSKAGMLVFESNETELGWDGYYKGRLCAPGVYVWKVRGTYRNGREFIMAGDVTLLKY